MKTNEFFRCLTAAALAALDPSRPEACPGRGLEDSRVVVDLMVLFSMDLVIGLDLPMVSMAIRLMVTTSFVHHNRRFFFGFDFVAFGFPYWWYPDYYYGYPYDYASYDDSPIYDYRLLVRFIHRGTNGTRPDEAITMVRSTA